MWRIVSVVFFLTFLFHTAQAINSELELKILNAQKKEVEPGASINVLAVINNPSDTDKEIQIRFSDNQPNWKFISDYSSIKIEKNANLKKIIGIKVPQNFFAGDYKIVLEAVKKPDILPFAKVEIPIFVNSKYEISITKMKSPTYIFSGDDISISYLIENLSNLDVKIKTTTIKGPENKVTEVLIPKDSSIITHYKALTEKKIGGHTQQSVILIAQVIGKPETEASAYTSIDIFPSEAVKFDKYERFPVKVSGIFAASNRTGKQLMSSMYDVLGAGTIGKERTSSLDFHLRGPDRTGNPLIGLNDEYYLKFLSQKMFVAVGDYNFGLSELTESSRNGRGLELRYMNSKWSVGSYFNIPRYYPLIRNVASAFTSFNFNQKNGLKVGLLTKVDTTDNRTQLFSITAHTSPFPWITSEAEVALSQNKSLLAKAYKGTFNINLNKINTHLVFLYADPLFLGFVNNSIRLNAGASLNLKKFSISLNYDVNRTNMALDTLFANMPFSKNMNLTTSFRISPQNTISLSANQISLEDRSPTPLFNYTKTSARFNLQSKIKSINLAFNGDVGNMINRKDPNGIKESLYYNTTFTMYYLFSKRFSGNIFTSYQGGQKNITGVDRIYYGGSLKTSIKERLSVSVQYNSNYEWQFYNSDRSLFSLNIFGRINKNNELNLMANYDLVKNTLDRKEYNVQIRFVHTLNVPVGKKKNIGSVSGKIVNHGVDKINGILVNLNGMIAITDKVGNFRFPVVPVGEFILEIDAASLGLSAILENPGPLKVVVEPGKQTLIECPMTTSGQIAGQIRIEEDGRANQKGFIPVKDNIERLIVEATNGIDLFRIYTDKDKAFRFEDLRPGKWKVKIYTKGLPLGYKMVSDHFEIDLTSGKHEFIDVVIQKKARQIQFQSTSSKLK